MTIMNYYEWPLALFSLDAFKGALDGTFYEFFGTPSAPFIPTRALQWGGNPYGNGFGVEMDGNGVHLVKMLWIGLDLGEGH